MDNDSSNCTPLETTAGGCDTLPVLPKYHARLRRRRKQRLRLHATAVRAARRLGHLFFVSLAREETVTGTAKWTASGCGSVVS